MTLAQILLTQELSVHAPHILEDDVNNNAVAPQFLEDDDNNHEDADVDHVIDNDNEGIDDSQGHRLIIFDSDYACCTGTFRCGPTVHLMLNSLDATRQDATDTFLTFDNSETMAHNSSTNNNYSTTSCPSIPDDIMQNSIRDYIFHMVANVHSGREVAILYHNLNANEKHVFDNLHQTWLVNDPANELEQKTKIAQLQLRFSVGNSNAIYDNVTRNTVRELLFAFSGADADGNWCPLDDSVVVKRQFAQVLEKFGFISITTQFHYALITKSLFPSNAKLKTLCTLKRKATATAMGVAVIPGEDGEQEDIRRQGEPIEESIVAHEIELIPDIPSSTSSSTADDENEQEEEELIASLLDNEVVNSSEFSDSDVGHSNESNPSLTPDFDESNIIRASKILIPLNSVRTKVGPTYGKLVAKIPNGYGLGRQHIFGATNIFVDPRAYISLFINSPQVSDYLSPVGLSLDLRSKEQRRIDNKNNSSNNDRRSMHSSRNSSNSSSNSSKSNLNSSHRSICSSTLSASLEEEETKVGGFVREVFDSNIQKNVRILNLIITWDAADLTKVSTTQIQECFSALFLQCTNMKHLSNSHFSNFLLGLNNQQDKGEIVHKKFYSIMIDAIFKTLDGKYFQRGNQDTAPIYKTVVLRQLVVDYGLAKALGGRKSFDQHYVLGTPYTKVGVQSISQAGLNLSYDPLFDLDNRINFDYWVACERLLLILSVHYDNIFNTSLDRSLFGQFEIESEMLDNIMSTFFPFSKGSLCSMVYHSLFDHDWKNARPILGPLTMNAKTLACDIFHVEHNCGKHQLEHCSYISQKKWGNKTGVEAWQSGLNIRSSNDENDDDVDNDDDDVDANVGKKPKPYTSRCFHYIGDIGNNNMAPIGMRAGACSTMYDVTPIEDWFPPNFLGNVVKRKLQYLTLCQSPDLVDALASSVDAVVGVYSDTVGPSDADDTDMGTIAGLQTPNAVVTGADDVGVSGLGTMAAGGTLAAVSPGSNGATSVLKADEDNNCIMDGLINLTNMLQKIFRLLRERDHHRFKQNQGYMVLLMDIYDTMYTTLFGSCSVKPYDIILCHTIQYFVQEVIELGQTYISTYNTQPNESNHPRIKNGFLKGGHGVTTPSPLFLQNEGLLSIMKMNFWDHATESVAPTFEKRLKKSILRAEKEKFQRNQFTSLRNRDLEQNILTSLTMKLYNTGVENSFLGDGPDIQQQVYSQLMERVVTYLKDNGIKIFYQKLFLIQNFWEKSPSRLYAIIDPATGTISRTEIFRNVRKLPASAIRHIILFLEDDTFSSLINLKNPRFDGTYPDSQVMKDKIIQTMTASKAESHNMIKLSSDKVFFSMGKASFTQMSILDPPLFKVKDHIEIKFDFNNQALIITLYFYDVGAGKTSQYLVTYKFKCIQRINVTLLKERRRSSMSNRRGVGRGGGRSGASTTGRVVVRAPQTTSSGVRGADRGGGRGRGRGRAENIGDDMCGDSTIEEDQDDVVDKKERYFISIVFNYGPFSITRKNIDSVTNKATFVKDSLPFPPEWEFNDLFSEIRFATLTGNNFVKEFMETLVRDLPPAVVGCGLRNVITTEPRMQYMTEDQNEIFDVKARREELIATFLNGCDQVTIIPPIPTVFPESNSDDAANKVYTRDMPVLTTPQKAVKRALNETLKEFIYCLCSNEDERKDKFARRCRCGELIYINTKGGGNRSCGDNKIHNSCDNIPSKNEGCCPLN